MQSISIKSCKTLITGSRVQIVDNSGVKIVQIISFLDTKGVRRRLSNGGVGDVCTARLILGPVAFKKKILKCIIVHQKKSFLKMNGERYFFKENSAVLVDDDFKPVSTKINVFLPIELKARFEKIFPICKGVIF